MSRIQRTAAIASTTAAIAGTTAAITTPTEAMKLLLQDNQEHSAFLQKQSDRYLLVVCACIDHDISIADLRETFQQSEGSDWPKNESGGYIGEVKAQSASTYAKAFNKFRSSVGQKFETVKDKETGRITFAEGKGGSPIEKTKAPSAGSTTGMRTSKAATVTGGPALWAIALADMLAACAKERVEVSKLDRAAKKARLAAIVAKVSLIEELADELELELELAE